MATVYYSDERILRKWRKELWSRCLIPSGKLTWQWKMNPDWRCIHYWKWGFSIAMFDYRSVDETFTGFYRSKVNQKKSFSEICLDGGFVKYLSGSGWENSRVFSTCKELHTQKDCVGSFRFGWTRKDRWYNEDILLMAEILHHLGCIKPCK